MNQGVVLLSGGMDSLVTAAVAEKECEQIYFVHINYGQRTEAKELNSFWNMVSHYKPQDILITELDYLREKSSSSLTDTSIKVETYSHSTDIKTNDIPNTYVPFRNTLMLAVAVSWAESIGADRVYIGAVEEDSSGYPDCREKFFKAFNEVVKLGTKNQPPISVITPVIHKTKKEIVLLGKELGAPLEYSWSCYKNNEKACSKCASCHLRLKAFHEAGLEDPIPYENNK